ncbi:unnamed protein product [Effrenium voratum]|uniref:Uncharacterized protein n=1 Tax=Effrenium voratum TaxID=2562239 RepID=A0AA36HZG4_9DINO|nr:unnamed protein product [Effrenium voratum]
MVGGPASLGAFMAPPCGTSSKARCIQRVGENLPKPLRTSLQPDGVPGLSGADFARVSAANCLYDFAACVMQKCLELDKIYIVENPRSSLFRETTPIRRLTA